MTYRDKKSKNGIKSRLMSMFLIILFLLDVGRPTLFAISGPSQPETAAFTPASSNDLVNLFTGNFSYNIPLFEVDGYPLNIAYDAGVTPEQEASWVGLGWSLNPGSINRDVRGIPDDFNGDSIVYKNSIKDNITIGVTAGVGGELIGTDALGLGLGLSTGFTYNNYRGFDITSNAGLTLSLSNDGKGSLTGALSVTNSSMNGMSISPSVGLGYKMSKAGGENKSLSTSLTASTSYSSRSGIQQVSFGVQASVSEPNGKVHKEYYKEGTQSMGASSTFGVIDLGYALPRINTDFTSAAFSGRFTFGSEFFLSNGHGYVNGSYSNQKLRNNVKIKKAYGCLNSANAKFAHSDIMDFSRENEYGFSFEMPALPIAKMNPDILVVSGQGISGSYKPFDNSFGVIMEPSGETKSIGGNLGVETAIGNLVDAGANLQTSNVNGYSGAWGAGNNGMAGLGFGRPSPNHSYENVYYQEANEKGQFVNETFYNSTGGNEAVRFNLKTPHKFEHQTNNQLISSSGGVFTANNNFSQEREKRNKPVSILTAGEVLGDVGVTKTYENAAWSSSSTNNPHHIGEISIVGENGKRYVYGLPVYNLIKNEVTFAVGTTQLGAEYGVSPDCENGTIVYSPGSDDTKDNNWGLDYYYNEEITPEYAHSYLPTAILGTNYIDADDLQGPSPEDFGEWVKFEYEKLASPYKWRIPHAENTANFNAGKLTDKTDDKASFVYGEKELVYLNKVETRNYILDFYMSDRIDAYGVTGRNGAEGGVAMRKLDSIAMFSRVEQEIQGVNAIPIKTVHFEYETTSLLVPQSLQSQDVNQGKLTLKKVYFTYKESKRAKYNPYVFTYSDHNPAYHPQSSDRWGAYKDPAIVENCNISQYSNLPVPLYPYAEQDEATANLNATAWNLTKIDLPSGGRIEVDYESDRYAFVQQKEATTMKKMTAAIPPFGTSYSGGNIVPIVGGSSGTYFGADMQYGFDLDGYHVKDYVSIGEEVYFRSLVKLGATGESSSFSDFISGYAVVSDTGRVGNTGYIQFNNTNLDGIGAVNPVLTAALQYGRIHLPNIMFNAEHFPADGGLSLQILEALVNQVTNLGDMFSSPNRQILDNGRCSEMYLDKSWLKLKTPSKAKFGGGHRVSEVRMYDNWNEITGDAEEKTVGYGRTYTYDLEDGTCSGVASNEPMMGGEESALVSPIYLDQKNTLAPDNSFYVEEPFAKSYFPNPTVGYSRVTVEEFQMKGSKRSTGTGVTVNEYYTSKDFPTIYGRTDLKHFHHKSSPINFGILYGHDVKDFITFSQGFMVETNDMHGKQKKVSIYGHGQNTAIQSTEYYYKSEPYYWKGNTETHRLVNDENTVITPEGVVEENKLIGMFYSILGDSRKETSDSKVFSVQVNVDVSAAGIFAPITVPSALPRLSLEKTAFKYASVTKTIQKFGILERVVTNNQGTVSEESYLAYDSETGSVLLTKTENNFDDSYYSLNFPAHWGYDGMGPAHSNVGVFANNVTISADGTLFGMFPDLLSDADEVVLYQGGTYRRGWVIKNPIQGVKVIDVDGNFISGVFETLKVYRSGKRNLLGQNMMEIISMTNPLQGLFSDSYSRVMASSGMEYGNIWRTICNCFGPENSASGLENTNPYVVGARGMWRPIRTYTHLTARTQSNTNANTNIRQDGIFSSYSPLYERNGGDWMLNPNNWTYTTEVTDYSPEGYELETRDALGRFGSTLYGYNKALQVAVAQNAQQIEIGYDGFEDAEDASCGTDHMRFIGNAVSTQAHTGRKSILVGAGQPVGISHDLQSCDLTSGSAMCNLQTTITDLTDSLIVTADCFIPPLNISYEVVQGDGIISMVNNGIIITGDGVTPGSIIVQFSFTDAENCYYEEQIVLATP